MKAKANALLLCTLMIASALAGCAGDDVERTLTQADCDAIGDGYTLDSTNNACVTTETVTNTVTVVMGCTDSSASNYDAAATEDDGSCVAKVEGCMDETAANYDDAAEVDSGMCAFAAEAAAYTPDINEENWSAAWSAARQTRECSEVGTNRPCEIVELTIGDASTFDPADAYDSASGDIIENVFDTLYRYAGDGAGNSIIIPRLATGHTVSTDGLTYTFSLRDDVKFSNGDQMTADDVVFSWCRVLEYHAPESHVDWILSQNLEGDTDEDGDCDESMAVVDATTFTATLGSPYSGFVSTIAYTVGAVVNSDLCNANRVVTTYANGSTATDDWCHGWMDEAPLGAGTNAYIVDTWIREDRIVLTPNWLYWEEGNFAVNRYTSSIVTEASTRLLAFQDGEADFGSINIEHMPKFCYNDLNANGVYDEGTAADGNDGDSIDDKPNVMSKDGYICKYRETFTTTLSAMNLNPKDADGDYILNHDCDADGTNDCNAMSIPAVRLAVSYAFDYEGHRRDTYDNSLAPQYGPIPTGFLYADTQTQTFNYNLTYAEELLENAGFIRQYDCAELANNNTVVVAADARDGSECRLPSILRVMANEGNDYRIAMAGQLQQALGSIGVATDGSAKPWAEYLTQYYAKTFEIRFSGWAPDYLDPDNYWSPFASSTEDVYGTGYSNAAVDAALLSAKSETDDTAREGYYQAAFDAWKVDPNMIIIGQYNGVGVKHDDVCSAPWSAIGSAHWFDYDKLPMVDGALVGSCE